MHAQMLTIIQQHTSLVNVIYGFDMCKLGGGSSKNLLNGTPSQNSPITVLINIITATTAARTLNLILNFDFIFEIDPSTAMVSAKV